MDNIELKQLVVSSLALLNSSIGKFELDYVDSSFPVFYINGIRTYDYNGWIIETPIRFQLLFKYSQCKLEIHNSHDPKFDNIGLYWSELSPKSLADIITWVIGGIEVDTKLQNTMVNMLLKQIKGT